MLSRWAPLDMDRDLSDVRRVFGEFGSALMDQRGRSWLPALDIISRQSEIELRLDMPGVDVETNVDIEVNDGILTISGERHQTEVDQERETWMRRESTHGSFSRSISLPQGVDATAIRATYDQGVLKVVIPLPEKPKSKVKIDVGATSHRELSAEATEGKQK